MIPWLWDGTKNVWDYYYPNNQSARMMWYHDHAIGQTRLNAYAGVATGYIVQDRFDSLAGGILQNTNGIPFLGQPIVFQDKVFWNDINDPFYPGFVSGAQIGDLWYPWFYDPAIWPIAKGGIPPSPSAIPEFFGDTMLANGHVYPFHEVGAGWHRFRFLNACNARWLDLSFVQENPAVPGEPLFNKKGVPVAANVDVWQIGTEGGFLQAPVRLVTAGVPSQPFLLGPAERADLIVRFNTPVGASNKIILYNVAGAPFPGGAPIFDWFVGNKNQPVPTTPGFGPNTRTIMQFRVVGTSPNNITIPATLPGVTVPTMPAPGGGLQVDTAALATQFPGFTYNPTPVDLSLNEVVEPAGFATGVANSGRLLTLIGNRANPTLLPFGAGGTYYFEPPTETVTYNTVRIWRIFNFTADAHPMHFHLFNVQVLVAPEGQQELRRDGQCRPPAPERDGPQGDGDGVPGPGHDRGGPRGGSAAVPDLPAGGRDEPPAGAGHRRRRTDGQQHGALQPEALADVRDQRRRVCLALPHPRARGARHDAAAGGDLRNLAADGEDRNVLTDQTPRCCGTGAFFPLSGGPGGCRQ